MATPASHATTATTLLTSATAPNRIVADAVFLEIQAHALLSRAAGTGTRYTDAEAALTRADKARNAAGSEGAHHEAARTALTHAHLADL